MPDLAMGDRIKDRVRAFFTKGVKSGNKIYDESSSASVDASQFVMTQVKSTNRLNDAIRSQNLRLPGAAAYNLALDLVRVPLADRAGNCGEMAALAGYYVLTTEFLQRNLIYTGEISSPGDHVFCLVAAAPLAANLLNFASVSAFTQNSSAGSFLIIDPWLNTTSSGKDYLTLGGQKLDKWQSDGKRISWTGSQGPGWYPPGGEYKTAFAAAPVALTPL